MTGVPHIATSVTNGARLRPLPAFDVKSLPKNIDAEASVLGGIILRNETLALLPDLEVDDFYDARHKVVFQAIRNLEATATPIDVVTLEVEIEKQGKLDAIGGVSFLGELALRVPTADNVLAYGETVKTLAKNRAAVVAIASALERAKDWQHDPVELVAELAGELQRLDEQRAVAAQAKAARWVVPLEDFLGDEEPSDDDAEDWIIRDLIPRNEPMLWGGPMKGGKTWAALDLLISIALGEPWLGRFENTIGEPVPVVGLFLEDNQRRLRKRLWELCRARNITPNHPTLKKNLRLSRKPMKLPDVAHQRRLTSELKNFGAKFCVIDNLTRVMVGDPNKTTDAALFTRAWSEIGEDAQCATGFLHHTKKPGTGDQKSVDPFDTLRGSGDFGATARNIVITTPIRDDDGGQMMSEVRMRGNLDLRVDSFVLGFERTQLLDRWRAKLVDKGEIRDVRSEFSKQRKERKQSDKVNDFMAEFARRENLAITIAEKEGSVSQARLARELNLASARSVAPVLAKLVEHKRLETAGVLGYRIPRAAQEDLPV